MLVVVLIFHAAHLGTMQAVVTVNGVAVEVLPAKGTELNLRTINVAEASIGEPLPVAGNVTADVNL